MAAGNVKMTFHLPLAHITPVSPFLLPPRQPNSRAAIEDLTDEELAQRQAQAPVKDPDGAKATIKGLLGSKYTSTDLALDAASLYSARRDLYAETSPMPSDGSKGLSAAAEAERQALIMLAANAKYEKNAAMAGSEEDAEELEKATERSGETKVAPAGASAGVGEPENETEVNASRERPKAL